MRRYIFLLASIVVLLLFTIPSIVSGQFTFAFDMGRDMLWTRNMVELKLPTLIGPWGSIAGVYFGPLWYYLLAIPYIMTGGDPRGSVFVPLVSNLVTLAIGWFFLQRKKHLLAANIWAFLFAISPLVVSISSFAFHANLLPLVTLLFIIGLYEGPAFAGLPLAALSASFAYHFEPAAGVMLTGYLLLMFFGRTLIFCFSKKSASTSEPRTRALVTHGRRPWEQVSVVLGLFIIPFLPQMIFESRHDFVQTKSLVAYVRGENQSLGGVLPLQKRVEERVTKIARAASQSVFPVHEDWQKWMLLGILFIGIVFLWKQNRSDDFIAHCAVLIILFFAFHYLAYAFLFPAELKGWYLYGLVSPFLLSTGLIIEEIWNWKQSIGAGLLLFLILFSGSVQRLETLAFPSVSVKAPETVAAQLTAVDWIYADALADGKPFSIYTYTPPIYDYNYQYLIWWRGARRFGILPAEYSYVPGESSYIPWKERFNSQKWSPKEAKIAYLILEPDRIQDRIDGWLGNFTSLNHVLVQKFDSGLTVEKRSFP